MENVYRRRGLKNLRKAVCIGHTHMVTKLKKRKKEKKGASWSSMPQKKPSAVKFDEQKNDHCKRKWHLCRD